ncbi:restriction endonuclease subunit S [Bacteroidales bacterium OttesenSCG-928-L03]|nr:restriction endonuclease subunit S [Bacteroidales bacterium OttesenSCG-928-L03]
MKIDKRNWNTYRFDEFAENISQRIEPQNTDLSIYVGLEHLDPDSLHIKRHGSPSDVEGTKLKFYKGDVIFGKRRAYQRKAALAEYDGICSAHAMVLRAKTDIIDERLFPFFFHSTIFQTRAIDISVGGLSPTINWKDLAKQEFSLPPKEEQARLAELLWTADDVVEREKDVKERTEEYKVLYIENELITNGRCKIRLSEFGEIIRGVGYKPENLFTHSSDNAFILLRSNNISNYMVNYDEIQYIDIKLLKKEQILQNGDIAICMSNGSKELVGKAGLYTKIKDLPVSIGSFCSIFRPQKDNYGELVFYLMQSNTYRNQIERLLSGSNINNLKPSDIAQITFCIDDENIEKHIANLKIINDSCRCIINNLKRSQQFKSSLINQIF